MPDSVLQLYFKQFQYFSQVIQSFFKRFNKSESSQNVGTYYKTWKVFANKIKLCFKLLFMLKNGY